MKAIKMLQVAAHVDGRSAVHEYDCLLLEFVLGSRPDDSQVTGCRGGMGLWLYASVLGSHWCSMWDAMWF